MGQAKRRGSFEQRKAEGIIKNAEKRKRWEQEAEVRRLRVEARTILQKAGFKTVFHYINPEEPSRRSLVLETAGVFDPPWDYKIKESAVMNIPKSRKLSGTLKNKANLFWMLGEVARQQTISNW